MSVANWIYRPKNETEREIVEEAKRARGYDSYSDLIRDAVLAFCMTEDAHQTVLRKLLDALSALSEEEVEK